MKNELYLVSARRRDGGAWERTPKPIKTKKAGADEMEAWWHAHEANGYEVTKHLEYFCAVKDGEERSIGIHEYEPETHDRIYRQGDWRFRVVHATGEIVVEKSPRPVEKKETTPQPRRGRGAPAYA